MIKSILAILASAIFASLQISCTTRPIKPTSVFSSKIFSDLKIGVSEKEVVSTLGPSADIDKEQIGGQNFTSYTYTIGSGPNLDFHSVTIDSKSGLVVSKLWSPAPNAPESKLDWSLQNQFKGIHFIDKDLPICTDHVGGERLLVNEDLGIIMRYYEYTRGLESILWLSKDQYRNILSDIEKCPFKFEWSR
jgi:hypothetical protein